MIEPADCKDKHNKLVMNESDETIADEKTKDITKRLINLEEKLAVQSRCFL